MRRLTALLLGSCTGLVAQANPLAIAWLQDNTTDAIIANWTATQATPQINSGLTTQLVPGRRYRVLLQVSLSADPWAYGPQGTATSVDVRARGATLLDCSAPIQVLGSVAWTPGYGPFGGSNTRVASCGFPVVNTWAPLNTLQPQLATNEVSPPCPGATAWASVNATSSTSPQQVFLILESTARLRRNSISTASAETHSFFSFDIEAAQPATLVFSVVLESFVGGQSQGFPALPVVQTGGGSSFIEAPSGRWFDPPLALGFDFQQTGSSLFTDILTLPLGIDGDGLFEVQVGNLSLGHFAEGTGVDFVQMLGAGVPAFRIVGIDPAVDATDVEAFPVQLAFDTQFADFTMTPVTWRAVGTSCSDAVCASCPTTSIAPIGDAVEGNLAFGIGLSNGPANGAAGFYVGLGSTSTAPFPLFCGSVLLPLQSAFFDVGATLLPGTGTCDGAGSIALPLVPTPPLFGLFLTLQAITLCPQGGLGLTHAIEFPIGS